MPRRLTDQERAWRAITEKQFQSDVMKEARKNGWKVAHFHDSRKMVVRGDKKFMVGDADAKGFPDCCMAHPILGVVFVELKKELGKTSPEQDQWLAALREAGATTLVLRPSMWDDFCGWLTLGFPES